MKKSAMILVTLALAACTRPNPRYCDTNTPCPCEQVCDLDTNECAPAPDGGSL